MPKAAATSNAPGDFYVAKGECIACGAPQAEAPELMDFDDTEGTCFFRRQPKTAQELENAIGAVFVSCCRAVRYRGVDAAVQQRLAELGEVESIDVPLCALLRGSGG